MNLPERSLRLYAYLWESFYNTITHKVIFVPCHKCKLRFEVEMVWSMDVAT